MSKLLRLNKKNFRSLLNKITHNRNQIDIKTEFIVNKIIKDVLKNGVTGAQLSMKKDLTITRILSQLMTKLINLLKI